MNKKSRITIVITLMLIAVMLPLSAFAGSVSSGGITLNFPDNQIACNPTFNISTSGVNTNQTVRYNLFRIGPGTFDRIDQGFSNGEDLNLDPVTETLTPGDSFTYWLIVNVFEGTNVITFDEQWTVECFDGCPQGFWKNHEEAWPIPTDTQLFSAVFEDAFPGDTLLDVVNLKGGKLNALGRQAVAAYLNATTLGDDYYLTADQVIDMFNAAYASGDKATYKTTALTFGQYNKLLCPLSQNFWIIESVKRHA